MLRHSLPAAFLATTLLSCSGEAPPQVAAFTPEMTRLDHTDWRTRLFPKFEELTFLLHSWSPEWTPGWSAAQADDKPLLIWLEQGHPLAIPQEIGMRRRALWLDGQLQPLMTDFQLIADDLDEIQRPGNPEAQALEALLQQTEERMDQGGVLLATPAGHLMSSYAGTDPSEFTAIAIAALEDWKALDSGQRLAAGTSLPEPSQRSSLRYPEKGMPLEVIRRAWPRDASQETESIPTWHVDYLWLDAEEADRLLPRRVGAETQWDEELASRLARFLLVDDIHGSGEPFTEDHLRQADVVLQGIAKIGDKVSFTVTGTLVAETAGPETVGTSGSRGMRAQLFGKGSCDLKEGRILEFNVVVEADSWGEGVTPIEGAWPKLGMTLNRANSHQGSRRIKPHQFDQYPKDWGVVE